MASPMNYVYTDGGKRKGIGAFAFVEIAEGFFDHEKQYNGELIGEILCWGFGKIDPLLNSAEAEVVAAREALIHMDDRGHSHVCIISDSTYVTHGVLDPYRMMINRPMYNHAWRPIAELKSTRMLILSQHVKGHNKQTLNTLCDHICNMVLAGYPRRIIDKRIRLFATDRRIRNAIVRTTR